MPDKDFSALRVALVHDWLIHMRGGEKVLEAMAEMFPAATIYTLFYDRRFLSPSLQKMKIVSSWLQHLPGIKLYYRWLLPFLPRAIRSLKIPPVDLVLSSSHCVAKAVEVPKGAIHVCYCHTPMRYLWGFEHVYFEKYPFFIKPVIHFLLKGLRAWDLRSNDGVHTFIANSQNIASRIKEIYGRESRVIYPPFDAKLYKPETLQGAGDRGEYYLVVSAFVPYKRVDLVIQAFNSLDRKLIIVGSGPLEQAYRKLRKSDQISFLGSVPSPELRELYANAKALIFPAEEDFGIVPVEAQACGTPVIAYGKGGALESVRHGFFFKEQTAESIVQAIPEFEKLSFDRTLIHESIRSFGKERFKQEIGDALSEIFESAPHVSG